MMIGISWKHDLLSGAGGFRLLLAACCLAAAGCTGTDFHSNAKDAFGRIYYLDGAGNWGFGVSEVYAGLTKAGYRGNIINYRWSPTFNPALDQTIGRPLARLKGAGLGDEIARYLERYPNVQVNIIALSAGTGVAIWACENLKAPAEVQNVIMLGSSLSSDYDVGKALPHIRGGIYVYHSPHDMILQGPVRTLGTIDGQFGGDAAGTVGLHPPGGDRGKIHNTRWSPRYERYGWTGAHTDATSEPFVQHVLAKHILSVTDKQTTRRAMWNDHTYAAAERGDEARARDKQRAFAQARPPATRPAGNASPASRGKNGPRAMSASLQ